MSMLVWFLIVILAVASVLAFLVLIAACVVAARFDQRLSPLDEFPELDRSHKELEPSLTELI